MKKAEIAVRVFATMDPLMPSLIAGGPVAMRPDALAGLSLVPWFCDLSIHWAVRLTRPGRVLAKNALPRIADVSVAATAADGLAEPGLQIELATANLGTVKRDAVVKADTSSDYGNQFYRGVVNQAGQWEIAVSIPSLDAATLSLAIACGSLLPNNGPWHVQEPAEAHAILMQWLQSREANINPAAVKHFVTWRDGSFHTEDAGMVRRFHGLALGFFRHRLAGSPFRWPEAKPSFHSLPDLEATARTVIGVPAAG